MGANPAPSYRAAAPVTSVAAAPAAYAAPHTYDAATYRLADEVVVARAPVTY